MPAGWPLHPLVYEINTRVWLGELGRSAGRRLGLGDVPASELDAIARLGCDAVWLMGVWTTGPLAVAVARSHPDLDRDCRRALPDLTEADLVGSPYAIAAYRVPEPLGGDAGLAALREQLAARGLKLLLDFVPNHTALDHPFTDQRPDAFVAGTPQDLEREPTSFFCTPGGRVLAHGRDPYFPAWTDTAQLNAAAEAGRAALREWLLGLATRCDGLRCDMAMLLLPEVLERTWGERLGPERAPGSFWRETIAELRRRHPAFLLLAEAYWGLEGRLLEEGFDFVYDKTLYDRLRGADPAAVRAHLGADLGFQSRLMRFVENHDEERAAAAFGVPASLAAAALALCAPGMKLLHEGQLEGRTVRLPVQLARRPEQPPALGVREFYTRLLRALAPLKRVAPQLAGVSPLPGSEAGDLVALRWPGGLCVANLGPRPAAGSVSIAPAAAGNAPRAVDRLAPEGAPPLPARLSVEVRLGPWGVSLLEIIER